MTFQELTAKVHDLEKADDSWLTHHEVLIDLNGLAVEIEDVQFDKDKGAFYIVARRR